MSDNKLTIQKEFSDRIYDTMCVDGLTVEEMSEVLLDNSALGKIMTKHGLGGTYSCWHNGYGIYGIRHVGEHLFVTIGNSCD
jgi:hypothetical protein